MSLKEQEIIVDYWAKYYATKHCTLCGNHGIIDTRGITTSTGKPVGRKNYCICPNGQNRRKKNAMV